MARSRAPANLLGLVASDSEDDLGGIIPQRKTAAPSMRDLPAAKRGRPAAATTTGASAANRVTKPAQKKAGGEAAARARKVLADRTNDLANAAAEPTAAKGKAASSGRPGRKAAVEAIDSETDAAPAVPVKKRGRGRPKAVAEAAMDTEGEGARGRARAAKRGVRHQPVAEDEPMDGSDEEQEGEDAQEEGAPRQGRETSETQFADSMGVETTDEKGDVSTDVPSTAPTSFWSPTRTSRPHHHTAAAPSPARARGATTAVDRSAAGDANVRRRLGDLTKKYAALESRYRDLKAVGVTEAERNFDRLKKHGEERTKAAKDLIASLQAELVSYRELAKEGARAKREWEASDARAADLQTQVGELKAALGDAKAEAKTLATKLAAARTAAADVPLVPGSAMKLGSHASSSSAHPTTAAAAASAARALQACSQTAQLKEDLYGDLTGLLVRSAKRDAAGRELYDCIQTGRNGSLHFKLCIGEESAGGSSGSGSGNGGESTTAQFVYTPQLDPSRDAALIELLPDYLVEEISFPRIQAAKFYKRVMQSLTEGP